MAKCYFELRKKAARGTDSIAADMMRHMHTRQHLGKTVVVCDRPYAFLGPGRKQWLKLSRSIQRRRAGTLNADKILKFTHTITRMQHMSFTHKSPLEDPEAEVYFLTPAECSVMPVHCYSVYVVTTIEDEHTRVIIEQLPAESLIVDYDHGTPWINYGLQPKQVLESQVVSEWRQVKQFLVGSNIDIKTLTNPDPALTIETMDDALDALLAVSRRFMRIANEFQRALELARPLRINSEVRREYDSVILLAHRVQALGPGIFTQHFLESYNEDDTFFLYDKARGCFAGSGETLQEAVNRHLQAGRPTLARALYLAVSTSRRPF
jgi:hypothetical protein